MQKTTNYNLPLFEKGETPAWVGDWNSTMNIIDANLGGGGGGSTLPAIDVTNKKYTQVAQQSAHTTSDQVTDSFVFSNVTEPCFFLVELSINCTERVNTIGFGGLLLNIRNNGNSLNLKPMSYLQVVSDGNPNATWKTYIQTPLMKCDDGIKFAYTLYGNDYTNYSTYITVTQCKYEDYI